MTSVASGGPRSASVRYACKCGRLAPVRALFFSDLCQKPVCRRPSCSVEEFESFYCGQLLVNLPSKEASLYQNRSSRSFACPACGSALATAFHEAQQRYFFLCAHCRWDSLALGLAEEDPDTLVMSAVARERESAQEDVFNALLSHYSATAGSAVDVGGRARLGGRLGSLQTLADSMKQLQREQQMKKFRLHRAAEMGGWRLDQAQARALEREQWLVDQRRESKHPLLAAQLAQLPPPPAASEREMLMALAQQRDMDRVSSLPQRLLNPLDQPRDAAQVSLSRPPLRAKRTWRCVESIERGSAGILVKPQISPMSGDSSLPVASSWFKKANLAVHYLPIVTFQRLPRRGHESELLQCVLLIENPLDDAVRLTLRAQLAASGDDDGFAEDAQVVMDGDLSVTIGAYEDPTLADSAVAPQEQTGGHGAASASAFVLQATKNIVKVLLSIRPQSPLQTQVAFRLVLETVRLDEEGLEVQEDSMNRYPVALTAPVES